MKHFTLAEAEALIPELESIFEAIAEITAKAEIKALALKKRRETGPLDPAGDAIERSQLQFMAQRIEEQLNKIGDLGAIPKGVDPALVDFPCRMDGHEVYLCWRLGEKRIGHYHETDEGFSGRKPLPKRRPS